MPAGLSDSASGATPRHQGFPLRNDEEQCSASLHESSPLRAGDLDSRCFFDESCVAPSPSSGTSAQSDYTVRSRRLEVSACSANVTSSGALQGSATTQTVENHLLKSSAGKSSSPLEGVSTTPQSTPDALGQAAIDSTTDTETGAKCLESFTREWASVSASLTNSTDASAHGPPSNSVSLKRCIHEPMEGNNVDMLWLPEPQWLSLNDVQLNPADSTGAKVNHQSGLYSSLPLQENVAHTKEQENQQKNDTIGNNSSNPGYGMSPVDGRSLVDGWTLQDLQRANGVVNVRKNGGGRGSKGNPAWERQSPKKQNALNGIEPSANASTESFSSGQTTSSSPLETGCKGARPTENSETLKTYVADCAVSKSDKALSNKPLSSIFFEGNGAMGCTTPPIITDHAVESPAIHSDGAMNDKSGNGFSVESILSNAFGVQPSEYPLRHHDADKTFTPLSWSYWCTQLEPHQESSRKPNTLNDLCYRRKDLRDCAGTTSQLLSCYPGGGHSRCEGRKTQSEQDINHHFHQTSSTAQEAGTPWNSALNRSATRNGATSSDRETANVPQCLAFTSSCGNTTVDEGLSRTPKSPEGELLTFSPGYGCLQASSTFREPFLNYPNRSRSADEQFTSVDTERNQEISAVQGFLQSETVAQHMRMSATCFKSDAIVDAEQPWKLDVYSSPPSGKGSSPRAADPVGSLREHGRAFGVCASRPMLHKSQLHVVNKQCNVGALMGNWLSENAPLKKDTERPGVSQQSRAWNSVDFDQLSCPRALSRSPSKNDFKQCVRQGYNTLGDCSVLEHCVATSKNISCISSGNNQEQLLTPLSVEQIVQLLVAEKPTRDGNGHDTYYPEVSGLQRNGPGTMPQRSPFTNWMQSECTQPASCSSGVPSSHRLNADQITEFWGREVQVGSERRLTQPVSSAVIHYPSGVTLETLDTHFVKNDPNNTRPNYVPNSSYAARDNATYISDATRSCTGVLRESKGPSSRSDVHEISQQRDRPASVSSNGVAMILPTAAINQDRNSPLLPRAGPFSIFPHSGIDVEALLGRCFEPRGPKPLMHLLKVLAHYQRLTCNMLSSLILQFLPTIIQRVQKKIGKINKHTELHETVTFWKRLSPLMNRVLAAITSEPNICRFASAIAGILEQTNVARTGSLLVDFLRSFAELPFERRSRIMLSVADALLPVWFDLLSGCTTAGRDDEKVPSNVNLNDIMHPGSICSQCCTTNVVGPRFRCLECSQYNLCGECFIGYYTFHSPGHAFQCLLRDIRIGNRGSVAGRTPPAGHTIPSKPQVLSYSQMLVNNSSGSGGYTIAEHPPINSPVLHLPGLRAEYHLSPYVPAASTTPAHPSFLLGNKLGYPVPQTVHQMDVQRADTHLVESSVSQEAAGGFAQQSVVGVRPNDSNVFQLLHKQKWNQTLEPNPLSSSCLSYPDLSSPSKCRNNDENLQLSCEAKPGSVNGFSRGPSAINKNVLSNPSQCLSPFGDGPLNQGGKELFSYWPADTASRGSPLNNQNRHARYGNSSERVRPHELNDGHCYTAAAVPFASYGAQQFSTPLDLPSLSSKASSSLSPPCHTHIAYECGNGVAWSERLKKEDSCTESSKGTPSRTTKTCDAVSSLKFTKLSGWTAETKERFLPQLAFDNNCNTECVQLTSDATKHLLASNGKNVMLSSNLAHERQDNFATHGKGPCSEGAATPCSIDAVSSTRTNRSSYCASPLGLTANTWTYPMSLNTTENSNKMSGQNELHNDNQHHWATSISQFTAASLPYSCFSSPVVQDINLPVNPGHSALLQTRPSGADAPTSTTTTSSSLSSPLDHAGGLAASVAASNRSSGNAVTRLIGQDKNENSGAVIQHQHCQGV